MNKQFFILIFLLIVLITYSNGQKKIILEHKKNSKRHKSLNLYREYTIKTNDTIYFSEIVDITDSTLSILQWIKTGRDTAYVVSKYGKVKDTTIVRPLYALDTTKILFKDILYIKKYWFKKREWLEPFGWILVGAALGVGLLPVAAIDDGVKGVKDWAQFEGTLLGVALPIIFIGTRQTKYDIQNKWKILIKQ